MEFTDRKMGRNHTATNKWQMTWFYLKTNATGSYILNVLHKFASAHTSISHGQYHTEINNRVVYTRVYLSAVYVYHMDLICMLCCLVNNWLSDQAASKRPCGI